MTSIGFLFISAVYSTSPPSSLNNINKEGSWKASVVSLPSFQDWTKEEFSPEEADDDSLDNNEEAPFWSLESLTTKAPLSASSRSSEQQITRNKTTPSAIVLPNLLSIKERKQTYYQQPEENVSNETRSSSIATNNMAVFWSLPSTSLTTILRMAQFSATCSWSSRL